MRVRFTIYLAKPHLIASTHLGVESGVGSGVESEMTLLVLEMLKVKPLSKAEIANELGKKKPTRYLNDLMKELIVQQRVEYTIPDKPNSRLQKYLLTDVGNGLVK